MQGSFDCAFEFKWIWTYLEETGADVFVVAPTGMGKARSITMGSFIMAQGSCRVCAFRYQQWLRRWNLSTHA
jgi:hypothetical protein